MWEEKHSYAVISFRSNCKTFTGRRIDKKFMGILQNNSYSVTGFTFGILTCPVLKLFYDIQRLCDNLVLLSAVNIDNRPDSAGVTLPRRIIYSFVVFTVSFFSSFYLLQSE